MDTFLAKNKDVFELELQDKVKLTPDTSRFRFKLPNDNDVLGVPVGKHQKLISEDENGERASRSYTPVSTDKNVGFVDFVTEIYKK